MTTEEKSWILYDAANSAFGLVVVTAVMPIFFKEYAAQGVALEVSTAWWGYANSVSSIILLFLTPLMGALADQRGWKKRLFLIALAIGSLTTTLLFFTGPGELVFCLILFVIAKSGWAGANGLYDAFLTDVAPPARMGQLSSSGFAWGYIGSTVPFLAVISLVYALKTPGSPYSLPPLAARLGFLIVTVWWLLLSIPLVVNVRQLHFRPPSPDPLREGFRRVAATLLRLREQRNPFLFLVAYFFIIDGVNTVITMSVAYGVDLGLAAPTMIMAILMIQVVAFPCSLAWGSLATRFRTKPLLQAGIAVYCLISLVAFLLPTLQSLQHKVILFWVLSVMVASSMGGIQALCRSFFARLIPPDRSGEFFGFYNISGRFATVAGPFLFGLTAHLTGQSRFGVLSLLVLLLAGSLTLARVRE